MIWLLFAAMTALAMAALAYPLVARPSRSRSTPSEAEFYRDQIAEIDRDAARGLLSGADAEGARVEAARRLLRVTPADAAPSQAPSSRARYVALAAIFLAVPAAAAGLYLELGSPNRGDLPLAARINDSNDIEALVAKVEQRLLAQPDDVRGYDALGPVYLRMGRLERAENAFNEAIRIAGPTATRLLGVAEAQVGLASGVVTEKARKALDEAVKLDPQNPRAQFLLAQAAEQDGAKAKARAIYEKILAEAPNGAPWIPIVSDRLVAVGGTPPAAAGVPTGPAAAAIAALPPEQRQAQIRTMVEGLATRLSENGQDLQGWLRLIRSWAMLGEKDKAQAALADARKALAADAPAVSQIDGLAKELGLGG